MNQQYQDYITMHPEALGHLDADLMEPPWT